MSKRNYEQIKVIAKLAHATVATHAQAKHAREPLFITHTPAPSDWRPG